MWCDMARSCDEWWIVMYEIMFFVIGFTTCMSMSMTTGRSHRSCLYSFIWPACHQETPCKLLYFIAKRVSHSSRSNSWRATSWRHDDGDHGVMPVTRWSWSPKMESKGSYMILAISCHYYLIACDVYHVFASCLLRTTVVNKMIPHNNFKKVFPLTVHRCDSSLFRSTTWWSGVIDSNVHIQRV